MPNRASKKNPQANLHQVGALPVRVRNGRIQVCLITTRETRRWVIPKGWPMKGQRDFVAAKLEAEEEAGLIGRIEKLPVGSFVYWKRQLDGFERVKVFVYLLRVHSRLQTWKEMGQRQIRWVLLDDACLLVEEPSLTLLLQGMRRRQSSFGLPAETARVAAVSTVADSRSASIDPYHDRA